MQWEPVHSCCTVLALLKVWYQVRSFILDPVILEKCLCIWNAITVLTYILQVGGGPNYRFDPTLRTAPDLQFYFNKSMKLGIFWHFFLVVCDDSCTLVQHIRHRDGATAELAYGETKGCFEKPSSTEKPKTNLQVPDILPLALTYTTSLPNASAMTNSSILIHPDSQSTRRYIMGTKMQMRKSGKSHKMPECSFHDLSNAMEGSLIKSMNQEGLQMTRLSTFLID